MRFLDEHWYRSMQLKGCERDFTVDPRVASDPDGLREEVLPRWYVLAFHWTLEDREGEYDPPWIRMSAKGWNVTWKAGWNTLA